MIAKYLVFSVILLTGGCFVTGPVIDNRSGKSLKICVYEDTKGQLPEFVLESGNKAYLGFEDDSISRIECFDDDLTKIFHLDCASGFFVDRHSIVIIKPIPAGGASAESNIADRTGISGGGVTH